MTNITSSFCIGIGLISLLSTPCFASYDTTFFVCSHVEAGGKYTAKKGDVSMSYSIVKDSGAGHGIEINNLQLGQTIQDHVKEIPLIMWDITGDYTATITCFGSGKFGTQKTSIKKSFPLNRHVHEIDISYACPLNEDGTQISSPVLKVFKTINN